VTTARPPNLVTVVLDCARAGSLSAYGAERPARTPNLDRLVQRGTLFGRAVAPGNWTLPSHMSLATGTYPWVHGLRTFRYDAPKLPKISEWLSGRGYETALFTEEIHLVAGYGLEDGYDERYCHIPATSDHDRTTSNRLFGRSGFVYGRHVRRLIERLPRASIPLSAVNFRQESAFKRRVSGEFVVRRLEEWLLRRRSDRPFHVFINVVDAHEPYPELAPRPFLGWSRRGFVQVPRFYLLAVPGLREEVPWSIIEDAYRAGIERADEKLGRIVAAMDSAGEAGRTMFVVTGDHGQSFGEGGNVYHGCGATESVLRVPLVATLPDGLPRLPRIDRWASLCEVPSWFKSAALGLEPFGPDGLAPVPFPQSPSTPGTVFAEGGPASDPNRSLDGVGNGARWNHRLVAAYSGTDKWVWDLHTSDVWRWTVRDPVGSPDRVAPTELTGPERRTTLGSIFGVRNDSDAARYAGGRTTVERAPLADVRMRSWGYD
jgi:hypothetical protein